MRASAQLLEEAKKATSNPNDPNNQQRLGQVRNDMGYWVLLMDKARTLEVGYGLRLWIVGRLFNIQ